MFIFESLKYSYELLFEPTGVFLFFCTIIFVGIAIFSWPRKHIQCFFVSITFLFLIMTIFFYHTIKSPSISFHLYVKGFIRMFPLGIGYSAIYIIFYWLSIATAFLSARKHPLTLKTKCLMCVKNSIVLWLFSKLWFTIAILIALSVGMIIPN